MWTWSPWGEPPGTRHEPGERPAQPPRPSARGDVSLRRALRTRQDDDRGHREGVGRLPGDDLPPVPGWAGRAVARDRGLGARELLQPSRRPGPGRADAR